MNDRAKQTVILGGGFAGLFTAFYLSKQSYPHPVTLIDKNERFGFKPLLYELLSGEMNKQQVCPRYEDLLDGSNVAFVQDTVQEIDLPNRTVKLAKTKHLTYHNLVLALGSSIGYFSIEGAKENTFPFRTWKQAIALSQHLKKCLQEASQTRAPRKRQTLLTVVVIGAGPTGVELAATLSDVLTQWCIQQGEDFLDVRLILINRGSQILAGDINSELREVAETTLKEGSVPVELSLSTAVTAVHPQRVEFERNNTQESIEAATVIWTTGTTIHPLIKSLPIPDSHRDKKGRLQVAPTLQLTHFPEVLAGGDCATDLQQSMPPTAQVAYQQGAAIARSLQALAEDRHPPHAQVQLRGSLLKLGLEKGGANLFEKIILTGKSAHLLRQGTYLTLLPTTARNFQVTTEWLSKEVFEGVQL